MRIIREIKIDCSKIPQKWLTLIGLFKNISWNVWHIIYKLKVKRGWDVWKERNPFTQQRGEDISNDLEVRKKEKGSGTISSTFFSQSSFF